MGENIGKDSIAKSNDYTWVLALEAPSLSRSSVRPRQPRKMKPHVNETKHEGFSVDILTIEQGQDIIEKVLTYFRNNINNYENSNGGARMGMILSATGSVLHPRMDTENLSASYKGSYDILTLGVRYIISENGQVQQYGPLTIVCVGSSGVAVGGQVNGPLVAAEPVQVVVGVLAYNPSEDEVKI